MNLCIVEEDSIRGPPSKDSGELTTTGDICIRGWQSVLRFQILSGLPE
jgi:hypothetical protein